MSQVRYTEGQHNVTFVRSDEGASQQELNLNPSHVSCNFTCVMQYLSYRLVDHDILNGNQLDTIHQGENPSSS